jgi:hypothetical protein
MKYTVLDVMTDSILISMENGNAAKITIEKGWSKERIEEEISKFMPSSPPPIAFDKIDDIPICVGDTNDIDPYGISHQKKLDKEQKDFIEREKNNQKELEESLVTYRKVRRSLYPDIGDQLDSLYHAGIFPTEMANKIKSIKDAYPKDMNQIDLKTLKEKEIENAELNYSPDEYIVVDGNIVRI